jgi:hypothetical protein
MRLTAGGTSRKVSAQESGARAVYVRLMLATRVNGTPTMGLESRRYAGRGLTWAVGIPWCAAAIGETAATDAAIGPSRHRLIAFLASNCGRAQRRTNA